MVRRSHLSMRPTAQKSTRQGRPDSEIATCRGLYRQAIVVWPRHQFLPVLPADFPAIAFAHVRLTGPYALPTRKQPIPAPFPSRVLGNVIKCPGTREYEVAHTKIVWAHFRGLRYFLGRISMSPNHTDSMVSGISLTMAGTVSFTPGLASVSWSSHSLPTSMTSLYASVLSESSSI